MRTWTQITRFGVTAGGHPRGLATEHIGGTARVGGDLD
jgi:hypothetical protein